VGLKGGSRDKTTKADAGELQRRNYSPNTIRPYLYAVEDFSRYFGKSPDKLGQEHLRQYQLHLLNDCKLTVETIVGRIAALRFFFVKVLRRPDREIDLVYPKRPGRLPVILSEEEVARLIESASTSYHRVILMTLYGTGLRREELCRLKVTDVGSTSFELCRRTLLMAPDLPSAETGSATAARLCPTCQTPLTVVERLTAVQIAWRFISKCLVDTS
jgi:Phage integrase, N-terminal SAM-like domain